MAVVIPVEISPCNEYTAEALECCVRAIETLDPHGEDNEILDKKVLKQRYGWKDPRGLLAYSIDSLYKDLYVYFDWADKKSPVNTAATRAFQCYGLDGAQHGNPWDFIRGSCVVMRLKPPMNTFTDFDSLVSTTSFSGFAFDPVLSVSEMVNTLMFFKDKNAKSVATNRDIARTMGSIPGSYSHFGLPWYMNMGNVHEDSEYVQRLLEKCSACGKLRAVAGTLKGCPCKTAVYCDADCQKLHWPQHEAQCKKIRQERSEIH